MLKKFLPTRNVIGAPVTALPFDDQITLILEWAKHKLSRVVCVANVHMLIEGYRDPNFANVLREADLVTPDGMPLVWMLKLMNVPNQNRVAGMDIMLALCKNAPSQNVSVFFLGSQSAILKKMEARLKNEFPNLKIVGMEPLPFRPTTESEDQEIVQKLNESGAGIILVSLGCPKQELWMIQHKSKVHAVMIGVGGVFPVYAGIHKRAPQLLRSLGLEWLYRLIQEPRRLWSRYFNTIPIFLWLALKQLFSSSRDLHTKVSN